MTRVEERLTELLEAAAPDSQGVALDAVRGEVHRRRTVRWSVAATVAVVVVVVGAVTVSMSGGGRGVHVTTTTPPTPAPKPTSTVDLTGTVPWINVPPQAYQPPQDARPCAARDVTAAFGDRDDAGGHSVIYLRFRNTSSSTCVLTGYPSVTATEPGGYPDLHADIGSFFQVPPTANIGPGQDAFLGVETDTYSRDATVAQIDNGGYCAGTPYGAAPGWMYHGLDIALPGGGTVTLHASGNGLDVSCGLHLTPFFVQQAQPVLAHDRLGDLVVSLEVPDQVAAGSTLIYTAELTNPTDRTITLVRWPAGQLYQPIQALYPDGCPGYLETITTPSTSVKEGYKLNCSLVGPIPAHATVRFEMWLRVPAQTAPGPLTFRWMLNGPFTVTAQATVTVTN